MPHSRTLNVDPDEIDVRELSAETNCVFSNDQVKPVVSNPLPEAVANMVYRNCVNIDTTYDGIKKRDLGIIYTAFANQPNLNKLSMDESKALFEEMCYNTREYLEPYFDLDGFFK